MNTKDEVMTVYADCHESWEEGAKKRRLHSRAAEALNVDDAISLLKVAIPDGYNDFDADALLNSLQGLNLKICIAREFSVCLYITGPDMKAAEKELKGWADECDIVDGELRVWWD